MQLRAVHVSSGPFSVDACSTFAPPRPDKESDVSFDSASNDHAIAIAAGIAGGSLMQSTNHPGLIRVPAASRVSARLAAMRDLPTGLRRLRGSDGSQASSYPDWRSCAQAGTPVARVTWTYAAMICWSIGQAIDAYGYVRRCNADITTNEPNLVRN